MVTGVISVGQVYYEVKSKKWGATESFLDIDLSLVSGKLGVPTCLHLNLENIIASLRYLATPSSRSNGWLITFFLIPMFLTLLSTCQPGWVEGVILIP